MHKLSLLMLPLLLTLGGCSGELSVEDPWVRAAPPGAGMTAGYLTLKNASGSKATLVGASSDSFDDVSLHETRVENGTSKMRYISALTVPDEGTAEFAPGGRHLMLFGVTSLGQALDMQLRFADGSSQTSTFRQIAIGAQ